jgi:hypothetical protein
MTPHKDTTLWQLRASHWLVLCKQCGDVMIVALAPEHSDIFVGYGARWHGGPDNDD